MDGDPLSEAALNQLGAQYLFPYQRLVISNILEERNQIVILPTGAGKSLCYMLPALLIKGLTLAVFPLLSLMSDQQRRLESSAVSCALLRGGQSRAERDSVWEACAENEIRVILTNPECLVQPKVCERLSRLRVAHFVVDEMHTVSEWGESFRPAYLEIGPALETIKPRVVTAFTATASARILEKVQGLIFPGEAPHLVRGNPDRPNITYRVRPTLAKDREIRVLAETVGRPALIFCRSRTGTEMTARMLRSRSSDSRVRFYHAGLSREEKQAVEQWFYASEDGILAATCAYGMGVDKPNIRTVIHRDVAPSVESYLQESGRAGRDGEISEAILLHSSEDHEHRSLLRDEIARERYEAMLRYSQLRRRCRRDFLLELLGTELEGCSGCDICNGEVQLIPTGLEVMLGFVSRQRRRYTPGMAAQILSGLPSYDLRNRTQAVPAGYGALAGWCCEDIEAGLEDLLRRRLISCHRRGPWRRALDG